MSVKDYNKEASLNVSISGINIAEGCAPSGINDAIRQLMADVKEESEAQAGAVAGAESAASSQVSALDSTLRALIAQEVAKCLKLSGGEMVGALTLSQFTFMNGLAESYIFAQADDVWANGARIQLNPGLAGGSLSLIAAKDGVGTGLYLIPGDGAYVDSNKIITSAGGTLTESIKKAADSILSCTSDASYLTINGGTAYKHGARIVLTGKDYPGWNGELQLEASDGTNSNLLRLISDGRVLISGGSLLALVASWSSGHDWYRKWSDGWIEQGGADAGGLSAGGQATFSLHTPFASSSYPLLITENTYGVNGSEKYSIVGKTASNFTLKANASPGMFYWYACGY